MNTLNKAFIKAFARDRTKAARPKTDVPAAKAATGDVSDPSGSLVMHDLYEEGDRIRFDGAPAAETPVVPESHLAFGIVQHVETFDPENLEAMAAEAVVVEDRTIGVVGFEADETLAEEVLATDDEIHPGESKDLAVVEIESDPVVEDTPAEPEPEIETSWGYDVGNDRPDIGQGATVEFVDEDAKEVTHVSMIAPDPLAAEVDSDERSVRPVRSRVWIALEHRSIRIEAGNISGASARGAFRRSTCPRRVDAGRGSRRSKSSGRFE